MLHSSLILQFFAVAFPAVALYLVGSVTETPWLSNAAGIILVGSGLILGLDGPVIARSFLVNMDFHEWNQAGRPDRWQYRAGSQPRATDLVWSVLGGLSVAAFFFGLVFG
ncbi:hypothetical protein N869_16055 [Cellulomonas bogoriensis 69B4 = DSM 16987]|uniref:Uncharacterized protein n=1 Tax=Cellulomonas bogoriensis 69B4 = DSM 16987 TaxID=1386082 RepID=A0A0A0BYU4_9CELL|nr:hypothetical protein [Cellulomonas bogoriensis]KGM13125.1 hypothetical protein N869_16055 [Cellulomonas bogoriensis 69B4 = DSM 16987]